MERGFVKLWRKSINSRAFQNEGLWKVWTWCLMKANHKGKWVDVKTGRGKTQVFIKPGQFIFGRYAAAEELRMKPSTVRDRLALLKKQENLDTQPDTHFTIISILNWDTYQSSAKQDTTPNPTPNRHPTDINKNDKNNKKREERGLHSLPDDFQITDDLEQWVEKKGYGHIDLDLETEKFLNYWKANGKRKKDWSAAWRNWIIKAVEFNGAKKGSEDSGPPEPVYEPWKRGNF